MLTRGKSFGTHPLSRPVLIDSVNLSNTAFDLTSLIKRPYQSEGRKATSVSASAKGFIAVPKSTTPSAPASLSVFTFDAPPPTPRGTSASMVVGAMPSTLMVLCSHRMRRTPPRATAYLPYRPPYR